MNTPKRTKRTMIFYYLAVIVALLLINSLLMPNMFATPTVEIDYSSFLKLVDSGQVEQVEIGDTTISALVRDKSGVSIIYQTGLINDPDLADRLLDSGVKFGRPRCTVEGWDTYYPQWKQGQITAVQCYKQLGISASTFYRLVRKYELEDESE